MIYSSEALLFYYTDLITSVCPFLAARWRHVVWFLSMETSREAGIQFVNRSTTFKQYNGYRTAGRR